MNPLKLIISILLILLWPSSAYANTPKTIDFYQTAHMQIASLNPAGELIAAIVEENSNEQVILINSKTQQSTVLLDLKEFSDKESSLGGLTWLDDTNIALTFIEVRKGNEELIDTKVARKLLILSLDKQNPKDQSKLTIGEVKTSGSLVHSKPDDHNHFLYAKNASYSKIYNIKIDKLNRYKQKLSKLQRVDGGQFKKSNEVAKIKGYALRWFFDLEGQVNAVLHVSAINKLSLSVFKNDKTTEAINEWEFDLSTAEFDSKTLQPIAQGDDPNVYYCLDLAERLNQTIYKVNFATDEEQIVYQSTAYDILDVDLTPDRKQLQVVRVINDGNIEHIYVNGDKKEDLKGSEYQNSTLTAMVSQSLDAKQAIYYLESHDQPGQFVFKDAANKLTLLGGSHPNLNKQLNSSLIESDVEVEGLTIPYLLSLPAAVKNNKQSFPLIVMPHGGPIGIYDNKFFNPTNELLVAHGYAVLRVNFRGSGGYSQEFKQAGIKQYGELMLEDIHQATLKVAKRDDIEQQKICIFGSSYGGYAAAMLTIKYPQTYQCGATFSGVSDLNLQLTGTNSSKKSRKWFYKHVGDVRTDYEKFKQQSPVYQAKNLTRPLMIYHGGEDYIVLPEQSYRLKLMLEKYQKPFEWHFNPEAGHDTGEPQQAAELHDSLLAFFAKHLG